MHDEADVRLVDAEAEGVGRDHPVHGPRHEGVLGRLALIVLEPAVVWERADSALQERSGHALHCRAGGCIDDGGARARSHDAYDRRVLRGVVPAVLHRVPQVGAVEAGHDHRW